MFKTMRRSERMLSDEKVEEILKNGEYGTLSTIGPDGYPYGVPLNYAYSDGVITFHCANGVGHKIENISYNSKVCFTVIGSTCVLPESFSSLFESVIAFGEIHPASDKLSALLRLQEKYSPDYREKGEKYAASSLDRVGVYEIEIHHMTAKGRLK